MRATGASIKARGAMLPLLSHLSEAVIVQPTKSLGNLVLVNKLDQSSNSFTFLLRLLSCRSRRSLSM